VMQGAPFWPATLAGWLAVAAFFLGTVVTTLATGWRWLMKPLKDQAAQEFQGRREADNGIGGRVGKVEDRVTRSEERLNMIERTAELAAAQNQRMERDMGGMQESVKSLADTVTSLERERLAAQSEIRESLAGLSAKMDLMAQLRGARGDS
jgi:membrane protein implicated in regulation of membrane protease activity